MANGAIADVGDVDVWPTDVKSTSDNATDLTSAVLARGALPVVLGGDHSITYPIVKGYEDEAPLHVIHFDAHTDYAPFIHDLRFTNGHAFRHIAPMEHVLSLTQVGIRRLRSCEAQLRDSITDGNRVMTMREFHEAGPTGGAEVVPPGARTYVSIDIDVLDLPLIPGCVSAEPNGMTYAELRDTLAAIAVHCDVVGFDLVEVNPTLDVGTACRATSRALSRPARSSTRAACNGRPSGLTCMSATNVALRSRATQPLATVLVTFGSHSSKERQRRTLSLPIRMTRQVIGWRQARAVCAARPIDSGIVIPRRSTYACG